MTKPTATTGSILLVCITVLGCVALIAVVVLVAVAPGDSDLPALMAALLSPAVTLIGVLAALGRVEQTKSSVDDLANGKMDAKIRAGVADVLSDKLIDPHAKTQLTADRAKRNG